MKSKEEHLKLVKIREIEAIASDSRGHYRLRFRERQAAANAALANSKHLNNTEKQIVAAEAAFMNLLFKSIFVDRVLYEADFDAVESEAEKITGERRNG